MISLAVERAVTATRHDEIPTQGRIPCFLAGKPGQPVRSVVTSRSCLLNKLRTLIYSDAAPCSGRPVLAGGRGAWRGSSLTDPAQLRDACKTTLAAVRPPAHGMTTFAHQRAAARNRLRAFRRRALPRQPRSSSERSRTAAPSSRVRYGRNPALFSDNWARPTDILITFTFLKRPGGARSPSHRPCAKHEQSRGTTPVRRIEHP